MLCRIVLHSARSGRTADLRLRSPVSLAPIRSAASDLLASDPSASPASASVLLSYADEHDPHNIVDCDKGIKELIQTKADEKERKADAHKQAQDSATAAAAEASVADLSASMLLVSHPDESKQQEEEITIDLLVQMVEPSSLVDHTEHGQDQAVSHPRPEQSPAVPTLPPGGVPAADAASSPSAAVSGPAAPKTSSPLPNESKEELESEYALINQQGEIDEPREAEEQNAAPADEQPVSVISAVKRKMSNPDLPFVMIEQQLAQWTKAASSWIVEHAKEGWQKCEARLEAIPKATFQRIVLGILSAYVVIFVVVLAGRVFSSRPPGVVYSGALVSNDATQNDPMSVMMAHQQLQLEELQQALHQMMIREEMREYQERREAEEARKNQLSERFKRFVQASGQSVANAAEAVGDLAEEARQDFLELCDECKEDWASLKRAMVPIRRSIDEKVSAVASGLSWFRDEAASYIRYGIDVPLRVPSVISRLLIDANSQMTMRLIDPAAMDGNSSEDTARQIKMAQALRRILREKGIDME